MRVVKSSKGLFIDVEEFVSLDELRAQETVQQIKALVRAKAQILEFDIVCRWSKEKEKENEKLGKR